MLVSVSLPFLIQRFVFWLWMLVNYQLKSLTSNSTIQQNDIVGLKASLSTLSKCSVDHASSPAVHGVGVDKTCIATECNVFEYSDQYALQSSGTSDQHQASHEVAQGSESNEIVRSTRDKTKTFTIQVKSNSIVIHLLVWFLSRRFELRLRRAYGGWDHSLRAYRTLPLEAPIFDYSLNGE